MSDELAGGSPLDGGVRPGAEACQRPQWGDRCCCNCAHHIRDYHHCTTTGRTADGGCSCSVPRGWICMPPEFDGAAYSGWSEHGMCEMHDHRPNVGGNRLAPTKEQR